MNAQIKTELRVITPRVAKEMLKRNDNNRPLKKAKLADLINQMNNDQWLFDGQPIRFDKYGRLLDGQHRLNAIIQTGNSYNFLIISGLEEEAFKVMDTGTKRTGGDALHINGEVNSALLAAAITTILKYKRGITSNGGLKVSNTNTDLIRFLEKHPIIKEYVKKSFGLNKSFSRVLTPTYIATFMFLFSEKSPSASEQFMSQLCTGLGLDKKSPINALRRVLIDDKVNISSLPSTHKMALIVKAWNYYRTGKEITYLKYNKENEKFPTII